VRQANRVQRGLSLIAEDRVFFGAKFGNQRHAEAILGYMGEPERAPGIDIESRRLMTGDAQRSAHRNHAGNRCQELGLAISGHPGDPDDLARSDGKADVVQLRGGQRLDLQHLAPGGAALGRSRGGRRRPIISSARLSASVAAVSTVATMRPARMVLTRSVTARTSFSLWVTSSTVRPSPASRRSTAKRRLLSCGVNTAVGSSRMRMSAPLRSAFMISRRWRSPTGRLPAISVGVECQVEFAAETREIFAHRPSGTTQKRALFAAEQQVFEDGEGLDQHEVLVDHPDPGGDRVLRRAEADGPAPDGDLAGIGREVPVEQPHQG
jgi:hypothetical protein